MLLLFVLFLLLQVAIFSALESGDFFKEVFVVVNVVAVVVVVFVLPASTGSDVPECRESPSFFSSSTIASRDANLAKVSGVDEALGRNMDSKASSPSSSIGAEEEEEEKLGNRLCCGFVVVVVVGASV